MTQVVPGHGALPVPPPTAFHMFACGAPSPAPFALLLPRLSREMICRSVVLRRKRLAELEAQMVDACDAAAAGPGDRRCWDRAAWQRYLDAATRLEGSYGPRMRRLRDDIARLDRLLDLPLTE